MKKVLLGFLLMVGSALFALAAQGSAKEHQTHIMLNISQNEGENMQQILGIYDSVAQRINGILEKHGFKNTTTVHSSLHLVNEGGGCGSQKEPAQRFYLTFFLNVSYGSDQLNAFNSAVIALADIDFEAMSLDTRTPTP